MLQRTRDAEDTEERSIVITREVQAPRALVFEAFTRAEHVDRWWGPRGFSTRTHAMDVRVGGVWRYTMQHAEYGTFENWIRYTRIVPGERLEFDHGAHEGDPDMFACVVTFDALEGGLTRITLRNTFRSKARRDEVVEKFGVIEGGRQTLDRLAEHLARR